MKKWIASIAAAALVGVIAGMAVAQKAVPIAKLPFSAARQAGDTLYISGQIARTADGKDVKESVDAETRQVMDNIGRILRRTAILSTTWSRSRFS